MESVKNTVLGLLGLFSTPPEIHIPSLTLPFLANSVLIQPLLDGELKNKNNPSHLYRAVQSAFLHFIASEPHKSSKEMLPLHVRSSWFSERLRTCLGLHI